MSKTIGITATARKISPEEIEAGILFFQERGYRVITHPSLWESDHQFAGTDAIRAKALQDFILDDRIDCIVCARGGYGTLRMVDLVDFSSLKKTKKLIAGYSDITVLHNHLLAQHELMSLHSTMPVNMKSNTPEALQSILDAIEGKDLSYTLSSHPLNRKGMSEGILFGGNLSLVYALQGSASLPDAKGKILFLEDLDEYLYHIDRMMLSLKRSGILAQLNGLIIGGFTEMKDNAIPFGKSAEEIILEHVAEYEYPVCFGFPGGHIPDNRTLIMGGRLTMKIEEHSELKSSFSK